MENFGEKRINLKRSVRLSIYVSFILIGLVSSIDSTALTTPINQVMKDLHLTEGEFGLFSSLMFSGKLIGSFTYIFLVNAINRKTLYLFTLISNCTCVFISTIPVHKVILYASRVLLGFSNIFYGIYFPVWCDQFGLKSIKGMMLTIVNMIFPLGGMIGQILSTYFPWKLCLHIETGGLAAMILITLCLNETYFSNKMFSVQTERKAQSFFEEQKQEKKDDKKKSNSLMNEVCYILSLSQFLAYTFGFGFAFLPLVGFGTFSFAFLENVLKITNKNERLFSISLSSIFGPIGNVVGGIISECIGGYQNKKSGFVVIVLQILSVIGGIAIPYTNGIWQFTCANLLFLFSFSALFPIVLGIIINSLPNEMKAMGNSFNNLVINLVGTVPGPYVYGVVNDLYAKENPRLAAKVLFMFPLVTLCLFTYGGIVKYRGKEVKKEKEEFDKGEELKDVETG
jgi:MFS family permease